MSWNYSGNPAFNDRDAIRFLIGDTLEEDGLVRDEEIAYALTQYSSHNLVGAACLRSLAARFSRDGAVSIGDVSANNTNVAKSFKDRADELDPGGVTIEAVLAWPIFGGTGTDTRDTSFYVGMDDIPGGPADSVVDPNG